ncbi:FecR family protein [Chitinophaga sp. RAB17]|uniref:FecR family protein n=1 Tax=Chitinophaga sp. RAB17 TaxID=3233049 RepID=UPI003F92A907
MHLSKEAIKLIARKYFDGTASEAEIIQLHTWYDEVNAGDAEVILTSGTEEEFGAETWQRLQVQMAAEKVKQRRRPRWWAAAAAALLLMGGLTAIFVNSSRHPKSMAAVEKRAKDIPAPSAVHAVLTLAGGKQILLDSAENGLLASQAATNIVKNDSGQIVYIANGHTQETQYNTLTIPAGSRAMSVMLADGTRVWLNAASSITYPTSFSGKERRVVIDGEGYFEVASNPAVPFVVARPDKGLEVQVLGTHFNVNAYGDEPEIRVTLISGAVRVSGGRSRQSVALSPGEQARVASSLTVLKHVDVDDVLAWKEGLFVFDATDIQIMMRQAARWYNITVQYPNGIPHEHFTGSLSTDASLSEFLKILDYSGVAATIKGKTVLINP